MLFSPSTFRSLPPALLREPSSARIGAIAQAFSAGGVDAGLRAMNSGVAHRYSGIFALDGELLRNTHMFDKLGEVRPEALEVVVLKDSFCQIVLREGFFLTDNTQQDRRLDYSPFQGVVMSYHGVPLLNDRGDLHGTLCHFDLVEQAISDEELACLQFTARLLPSYL
jgi:GAF domain-containing protein